MDNEAKLRILEALRVQTTNLAPGEDKVALYVQLQAQMREINPAVLRATLFWWHNYGDFYVADPNGGPWLTSTKDVLLILKDGTLIDTTVPRLRANMPELIGDVRLWREKLPTDDRLLLVRQREITQREALLRGHSFGEMGGNVSIRHGAKEPA